jgi:hypothetical protein
MELFRNSGTPVYRFITNSEISVAVEAKLFLLIYGVISFYI